MTSRNLGLLVALIATLLLIWLSLGVGIIGADGDPANRMYLVVVGAGLLGAILSRFRARGLSLSLRVMALLQALITVIALAKGLGAPHSGALELVLLNGFFIGSFLASAWLVNRAPR